MRSGLRHRERSEDNDEAIAYINEIGFLPLFKNEIPGFSLEERTVAEYWWSENSDIDPIAAVDTSKLESAHEGIVMCTEEGTSNISFNLVNGELAITGINDIEGATSYLD